MPRRLELLAAFAFGFLALAWTSTARATEDDSVTVVDVTPAAAQLDSDKLRTLIGVELHTQAVPSSDRRAITAKGALTIDVDPKTGEVSVTYVERAKPITRKVPRPSDSAAARSAVVTLAGNLARDEAGEIAADLRRQQTKAAPVTPPSPSTAEKDHTLEGARLSETLEHLAKEQRRDLRAFGWASFAAGAGMLAGGMPLAISSGTAEAQVLAGVGSHILGIGIYALGTKPSFDTLVAYDRSPTGALTTEELWAKMAREEHANRRRFATVGLIYSGVMLAAGTLVALDIPHLDADLRASFATLFFGMGGLMGVASLYTLKTDGAIETGLRAYELSSGRTIHQKEAATERFNISFVQGGAVATFGGTF